MIIMGKVAFVFPGQGSQYVGMGRDFCRDFPEAADIFERADAALGFSLSRLCFEGPESELNLTVNTQPAVLTASIACLEVFRRAGAPEPAALAGHSLGEYTALVAAGAVDFEDAVRLVRARGQYMQEAVPVGEGGMAAVIGLSVEEIERICKMASAYGVVEAVNLNCPCQVVIAGSKYGLEAAEALAREAGAKRFMRLPVSAPFHSSLMKPAGDRLAADLAAVEIRDLRIPVVANVTASFVYSGREAKELLVRQVYSPVRWEESMLFLINRGFDTFIEVGPGKVLSGLIKKIDKEVKVYNIGDKDSLEKVLALAGEVG